MIHPFQAGRQAGRWEASRGGPPSPPQPPRLPSLPSCLTKGRNAKHSFARPFVGRHFKKYPLKYNPYCLVRRLKLLCNKRLHLLTDPLIPQNREISMRVVTTRAAGNCLASHTHSTIDFCWRHPAGHRHHGESGKPH